MPDAQRAKSIKEMLSELQVDEDGNVIIEGPIEPPILDYTIENMLRPLLEEIAFIRSNITSLKFEVEITHKKQIDENEGVTAYCIAGKTHLITNEAEESHTFLAIGYSDEGFMDPEHSTLLIDGDPLKIHSPHDDFLKEILPEGTKILQSLRVAPIDALKHGPDSL